MSEVESIGTRIFSVVGWLVVVMAIASACASAPEPTARPAAVPSAVPSVESQTPRGAENSTRAPGNVDWKEAEQAIKSGRVKQATQTHARQVILRLKDGQVITAVEPSLDDVMRVIRECGAPCADILIASE